MATMVLAVAACAAVLGAGAQRALAHTEFSSSTPADGTIVDEPVGIVTIVFTGPSTPTGEGFVALDASGILREPTSVSTVDGMIFSLAFDPPLAGGAVGVRWTVQAPDTHPIDGAFSFTVNAPAVTTTSPPASATPPTTDPSTAEPVPPGPPGSASAGADGARTDGTTLEEFLDTTASRPGTATARVGRTIGLLGGALGIGGLAFAATTLRGSRREVSTALRSIRVLGAVVVIGAIVEYVGVARVQDASLFDDWTAAPRPALLLRLVGGVALAIGVARTVGPRAGNGPGISLSAATVATPVRTDQRARWHADRRSALALAGVGLLTMSFWFDGHTVSRGWRPLHAVVNSVHVLAGAVWVGGVAAIAVIAWARHRADRPTQTAELVVRFSRLATVALVAVIGAGALMAVLVLDSPGDLTGTQWGRILLLKTAAVGLAAVGGAYNHFRLLPAIEAAPDDPHVAASVRSTVTAEAIVLLFVIVVTASLVAAST